MVFLHSHIYNYKKVHRYHQSTLVNERLQIPILFRFSIFLSRFSQLNFAIFLLFLPFTMHTPFSPPPLLASRYLFLISFTFSRISFSFPLLSSPFSVFTFLQCHGFFLLRPFFPLLSVLYANFPFLSGFASPLTFPLLVQPDSGNDTRSPGRMNEGRRGDDSNFFSYYWYRLYFGLIKGICDIHSAVDLVINGSPV